MTAHDAVEQAGRLTRCTAPFNLAGLPIGLQVVSRAWADAKVLNLGYAVEQATEWHTHFPLA